MTFVWLCAGQPCDEGWHHVGELCLRINSSRESYDNAQHYCKNLGGNIASLLTDKQVHFVLEELQKHQLQEKVKDMSSRSWVEAVFLLLQLSQSSGEGLIEDPTVFMSLMFHTVHVHSGVFVPINVSYKYFGDPEPRCRRTHLIITAH